MVGHFGGSWDIVFADNYTVTTTARHEDYGSLCRPFYLVLGIYFGEFTGRLEWTHHGRHNGSWWSIWLVVASVMGKPLRHVDMPCTTASTTGRDDEDGPLWYPFWFTQLVTERGHQDGLHHGPLWVKRPVWTSVLHIDSLTENFQKFEIFALARISRYGVLHPFTPFKTQQFSTWMRMTIF